MLHAPIKSVRTKSYSVAISVDVDATYLNGNTIKALNNLIAHGAKVLISDKKEDRLVVSYLCSRNYHNFCVYSVTCYPSRNVNLAGGFKSYAQMYEAMGLLADYGFFIHKGSLSNAMSQLARHIDGKNIRQSNVAETEWAKRKAQKAAVAA